MISVLLYDKDKKELSLLQTVVKDIVAMLCDDNLNIVNEFDESTAMVDYAIINICEPDGLETAKQIRKQFDKCSIMIIADSMISPMKYLNPDIQPLSLLIKPYYQDDMKEVIKTFMKGIAVEDDESLWINSPDGKVKIPYGNILYIEATNKMLLIRLASVEYSTYGSLESFEQKLPWNFVRCHRSYIVNKSYLNKVRLSENYLVLEGDVIVPLSRSYKQEFRELVRK